MNAPSQPTSPFHLVGTIVGAIGGWGISAYCTSAWPALLGGAVLLICFTRTKLRPQWFTGAIVALGAYTIWLLTGAIIGGYWSQLILDIIALVIGMAWLWIRPGIVPVVYVALIQLGCLFINGKALIAASFGDPQHRALTAHCLLRIIILICLITGYLQARAKPAALLSSKVGTDGAVPSKDGHK